jgi:exopolyphosphatase/guanosine-5'-triphosphate,3'-diphosphate pyrophosphatase
MDEVAACVRDIDDALDQCPIDPSRPHTVIGVAGTVIQLAIGALGLTAYDRDQIDKARVPIAALQKTIDQLVHMTVDERLALPWMHPGRADVIAAGGLIVSRILRRVSVDELVVSESDILDGIAYSLLG